MSEGGDRLYPRIVSGVFVIAVSALCAFAATPISSIEQFRKIGGELPLDGDYYLDSSIDAASTRGTAFVPVGTYGKPFTGKFDGKGFVIRNLYIDRPNSGHVGLFGYVGAAGRIANVGVIDADVSGSFAVGALAGTNTGTVSLCYSSGVVNGLRQESNAGGLVGVNGGAVEKSYSTVSVGGKDQVGGLAGFLTVITEGRITDCYATGAVSGNKAVGGLVGYVFGGSITKSFSMGAVSARSGAGGLVGVEFRSANPQYNVIGQTGSGAPVKAAEIVNCFWDIDASGVAASAGGGSGKTTQEMRQRSTYENAGWDLSSGNGWEMSAEQPLPQIKSPTIPEYSIIYKAGANGKLNMHGADGTQTEYQLTLSAALTTPQITAVPNSGYHFVNWSDGDTRAARVDVSARDTAFMALFAPNAAPLTYYTLSYEVIGNGRLMVNDDPANVKTAYAAALVDGARGAKITAVPNSGNKFSHWSDGRQELSRSDLANGHSSFTAYFIADAPKTYSFYYKAGENGKLTRSDVSNSQLTTVEIKDIPEGASLPMITAVPDDGYRFVRWDDGVTEAARRDTANKNVEVSAIFVSSSSAAVKAYTLRYEVVANGFIKVENSAVEHTNYQIVVDSGNPCPRINAEPASGYRFLRWSDNSTERTRLDIATSDMKFFAYFTEIATADPNNPNGGLDQSTYTLIYEAVGSGKLEKGEAVSNSQQRVTVSPTQQTIKVENVEKGMPVPTITAMPNTGFYFIRWSDGVTDSVRKDVAGMTGGDLYAFATFGLGIKPSDSDPASQQCEHTYSAQGENGTFSIKTESGATITLPEYTIILYQGVDMPNITITAVPKSGYAFAGWSDGEVSPTRAPTQIFKDMKFIARFVPLYNITYTASVGGYVRLANTPGDGLLQLPIQAPQGSLGAEIIALPMNGYEFDKWSDGVETITRSDAVNENNTTFTALFAKLHTIKYQVQNPKIFKDGDSVEIKMGKLRINANDDSIVNSYEITRRLGYLGVQVEALPLDSMIDDVRYKFIGWDDGVTANARIDIPTESSQKTFTAKFVEWDYIPIGTFDELCKIGVDPEYPLNSNYELINDIDAKLSKEVDFNNGNGFTPIGVNATNKFRREFRGNGFTIKNLRINRAVNCTGLFGYTGNGAHIWGVRLDSVDINGVDTVGALIGRADSTIIDDCGVGGTVNGRNIVGGLVGLLSVNNVTNCYSTGTVTATGNNVGGLVGSMQTMQGAVANNNITLERCHSTGTVRGIVNVGGLIGRIYISNNEPANVSAFYTVKQCYSTGNVSGNGNNIGGLVGTSHRYRSSGSGGETIIEECYASGSVNADGSGRGVGGLVGTLYTSSGGGEQKINYCYATGNIFAGKYNMVGGLVGYDSTWVSNNDFSNTSMMLCYSNGQVRGNNDVGGFIGSTNAQSIKIDQCYYDTVSSGMKIGANKESLNDQIIGKSPEEMKLSTTYDGWNFYSSGKWAIDEGNGYPYLRSLGPTVYPPMSKDRYSLKSPQVYAAPRASVRGKHLMITAAPHVKLQIRFFDLRGRVIRSYATSGSARISLARVPSGRYIMELRENRKRLSVSRVLVR